MTTNLAKQPLSGRRNMIFHQGEGTLYEMSGANIDRDRLAIEVIHYWALIMVPLMEPAESVCESPSTPLGFGGGRMTANDDCEDE